MGMQIMIFIGRLGRDPELRYTPSGTAVAKVSVAVEEKYKDKKGEYVSKTEWIPTVFWGRQAEVVGEYLHKGSLLQVVGKWHTNVWEDREGKKRYQTECYATNLQMLDSKKSSANGDSRPAASTSKPASSGSQQRFEEEPIDIPEDDIPF